VGVTPQQMWSYFKQKDDDNPELSEDSDDKPHLLPAVGQEVVTRWMGCGCFDKSFPSNEKDVNTVISLLANNHAYWSGSYWRDYLFHVCNRHPIVGILACHPLHSLSKVERVSLEFLRVLGTVSWVVLMKHKLAIDDWMEKRHGESESHNMFLRGVNIYIHVTLPVTLVMYVLRQMAIQTGRPDSMLERYVGHSRAKCIQWCLMYICCRVVVLLFFLAMGLVAFPSVSNKNKQSYEVAWRSILQAYVLWFPKDNIMPMSIMSHPFEFGFYQRWKREEQEEEKWSRSYSSESSEEGFFSVAGWRGRLGF